MARIAIGQLISAIMAMVSRVESAILTPGMRNNVTSVRKACTMEVVPVYVVY
jgi:hypothetical protein